MPSKSDIFLVSFLALCHHVQAIEVLTPPNTIDAVEGTSVRIPCPQYHRILHPRRIRLVLWFKDNGTDPIKSFDGRERARLAGLPANLQLDSADLHLTPVTRRHSGRYRCRVDAEDDPTVVTWVTLTVRDAPVTPSLEMYNQFRDEIGGTEVHIVENSSLQLLCRIIDGDHQTWHITWLVRRSGGLEQLLTSETDRKTSEQRLEHNVTRADHSAALVCRAGTTAGETLSAEVTLRVAYGPDSVSLQCTPNSSAAGQEVTCSCHVTPARPRYQVTWLWGTAVVSDGTQHNPRGGEPRETTELTSHHGVTSHQLTRVTSRHDAGQQVTCQAVDPVSSQRRQAVTTLSVLYVPELVLSGPPLDLVEGDDAHFSCSVRAVPPAQFTYWLHNDRELVSSERIVAGPQFLIVRSLTPDNAGRYCCFANNTLGGAFSNTVQLRLTYVPVCRFGATSRRHAAPHRATFVSCKVRARPWPSAFQWVFQPADGGEARILQRTAHSDKGHSSVLRWKPATGSDYGQLLCRAANALGLQQEPCRFDIIPPEAPAAVQNCTVSMSDTVISCIPGTDGGMTPWYTLWLYGPDEKLVANWTENRPYFIVPVATLSAGEHIAEVVAETPVGQSRPVQVRFWPHPSVGPHTDELPPPNYPRTMGNESRRFSINSWVLGGAICALLAVVALVIVSVHVRCHCTPGSAVDSCRNSPGRPELTGQRSYPAQQPIYAEVQRRRPSQQPQQAPLPPRLSSGDWETPQPPRPRSRSGSRAQQSPERGCRDRRAPQPEEHRRTRGRSRTPQPTCREPRERGRTPQPSDFHRYRDRGSIHKSPSQGQHILNDQITQHPTDYQRTGGRSRTLQPPRRPGDRGVPVYRCRSLPVPPPTVANVRGRSLQPADTLPRGRIQADPPQVQTLSQSSVDLRRDEPDPADEATVQVHLQPPTPASTVSTVSTESAESAVGGQLGGDRRKANTAAETEIGPVSGGTEGGGDCSDWHGRDSQ